MLKVSPFPPEKMADNGRCNPKRKLIMNHIPVLSAAVVLTLGMISAAYGLESQSDQDLFTQQASSKRGSGSDQESTKKQSNPAKDQKADQNAQVTVGGAKSLVSGEIRRIEGEYYFIKDDETGDEVRLLVNKDANLDCSAAPIKTVGTPSQSVATDRQPAEEAPEASDRQKEQGQKKDETAVGSGFRIGACSFMPGDRIKAEVDDMGRVTTLKFTLLRAEHQKTTRSLGESAGTGALAIPGKQEKPGQLDMTGPHGYPPKEYAMLPVPLGELKSVSKNSLLHSSVKNAEGKVIGSVESLLMDSHTRQIEYAVVLLDDSKRLEAVLWAHLKQVPNQGKQEFILNTTHYQLSPSPGASKDRSLEVESLVADMRANLRAESRLNPEGTLVKIEITMQDRGYHVKGHALPNTLTVIVLRNQDTETHGFSSPLFKDVVIRTEGEAIEVKNKGIRSYHVPAGKTATLYFTQASRIDPSTGIRETTQYPFRCDIYPNMKGEFLVIETRGEMGGG